MSATTSVAAPNVATLTSQLKAGRPTRPTDWMRWMISRINFPDGPPQLRGWIYHQDPDCGNDTSPGERIITGMVVTPQATPHRLGVCGCFDDLNVLMSDVGRYATRLAKSPGVHRILSTAELLVRRAGQIHVNEHQPRTNNVLHDVVDVLRQVVAAQLPLVQLLAVAGLQHKMDAPPRGFQFEQLFRKMVGGTTPTNSNHAKLLAETLQAARQPDARTTASLMLRDWPAYDRLYGPTLLPTLVLMPTLVSDPNVTAVEGPRMLVATLARQLGPRHARMVETDQETAEVASMLWNQQDKHYLPIDEHVAVATATLS